MKLQNSEIDSRRLWVNFAPARAIVTRKARSPKAEKIAEGKKILKQMDATGKVIKEIGEDGDLPDFLVINEKRYQAENDSQEETTEEVTEIGLKSERKKVSNKQQYFGKNL